MADNVQITAGSGTTIATDQVTDGTLGQVHVQCIKVWDGTIDGTNKLAVTTRGGAKTEAISGGSQYETVAISQTDQAMGATGATGDYLEGVLCVVATAATSQVQIKDGSGSAITILPNNVGAGVGTYYVPLGLISTSGAWKITTAAGVTAIGIGVFT